uniref:Immunoglobulin V-set domain-containing protein n=1 Tax=Peromyscus maniculatus bairdii TaxID=230844 RepID=A0A8C8ULT6_PERMB
RSAVCVHLFSLELCSFSQSVLIQPPSISEALESTARLTCTLWSGISVAGKNIYKQMQGSSPWFFLHFYSDSNMQLGPGVTNRISGSKDTSQNAAHLHISELQAEDEADYYCIISESNVSHSDTGRWENKA